MYELFTVQRSPEDVLKLKTKLHVTVGAVAWVAHHGATGLFAGKTEQQHLLGGSQSLAVRDDLDWEAHSTKRGE